MSKSLRRFRRDKPDQLRAKDFLIDRMTQRLFILALVIVAAGLGFAVLGVVLVLEGGESGSSVIKMFGQEISTDSVGVACIFIGAVTAIFGIRRVLKTWEHVTK